MAKTPQEVVETMTTAVLENVAARCRRAGMETTTLAEFTVWAELAEKIELLAEICSEG